MKKILFQAVIIMVITQLFCALSLASGLSLKNTYVHPNFKSIKLHDIGVVTFKNESQYKKDIRAYVTEQFIAELNKRGWYVIHSLKEEDLSSPEKLNRIDAVLTGSIIDYRDYEPLRFGIKLTLTDLNTNQTLWSVQEVFDATYKEVTDSVKSYYNNFVDKSYSLMGHKIYLISMAKFLEFSLNKVIDTLD